MSLRCGLKKCFTVAFPFPSEREGELKVLSFHLDLYLVGFPAQLTMAADSMETCQCGSDHCGHSLLARPLHRKWKRESMREEQNTYKIWAHFSWERDFEFSSCRTTFMTDNVLFAAGCAALEKEKKICMVCVSVPIKIIFIPLFCVLVLLYCLPIKQRLSAGLAVEKQCCRPPT